MNTITKLHFSRHGFVFLLEEKSDFIQDISQGHSQEAIMRACQDKESYWIRVVRLKIYTEKSLARERSNSLA